MSWNNDHIPEIDLEYEFDKQSFANIAATLDKNGFGDVGALLRNMTANADVRAEKAVNSEANNVVQEVTNLFNARLIISTWLTLLKIIMMVIDTVSMRMLQMVVITTHKRLSLVCYRVSTQRITRLKTLFTT